MIVVSLWLTMVFFTQPLLAQAKKKPAPKTTKQAPTAATARKAVPTKKKVSTAAPQPAKAPGSSAALVAPKDRLARKLPQKNVRTNILNGTSSNDLVQVEMPSSLKNTSGGNASSSVHTIRLVGNDPGADLGETSALAVDNQYLIVPLHFISSARLAHDNLRLFVDSSTTEARVVELDLKSNLALLKTAQMVSPSLTRSQLRFELPGHREPLNAASSPDRAVSSARFSELRQQGQRPLLGIEIESRPRKNPIFFFDQFGRLMGVASKPESDKMVWATSTLTVWDLLKRQQDRQPSSVAEPAVDRKRQLNFWQDQWTKEALSSNGGPMGFAQLNCRPHLLEIKNKKVAAQMKRVNARHCTNKAPIQLHDTYTAGLEMLVGDYDLLPGGEISASEATVPETLSADYFADHEKTAGYVNLLTPEDCHLQTVTNQRGFPVYVRYCTSAIRSEPGFNDTVVSLVGTQPSTRNPFAIIRLRGFSQVNTKAFISKIAESFGSGK